MQARSVKLYRVNINVYGSRYGSIIAAAVDSSQAKWIGESWAMQRGVTMSHCRVTVTYSQSLNAKPVYTV